MSYKFKRKLSICAPKMEIRPRLSWVSRSMIFLPSILFLLLLVGWAYDRGSDLAGFHRAQSDANILVLRGRVGKLESENVGLEKQLAQYEQKINISQAENKATEEQLKSLADENGHLQEDLVFFQNLTAPSEKEGDMGVHRLTLEHTTIPGEYHLKMLLVQSGKRVKVFNGYYQLVATTGKGEQKTTVIFPNKNVEGDDFKLSFRYYRRVEQNLEMPPDVSLDSVQVRIFEQGNADPKVRQSVSLPETP